MNTIKRMLIIALLLCVLAPSALADLDLPYDTYTYDYWGNVRFTPAAYAPVSSVSGTDLTYNGEPVGAFSSPQDICRSPGGLFYLADTGNNRIVVLNEAMDTVINIIDGFELDGRRQTFDAPTGVGVSLPGALYIADSQNRRIVALNPDGTLFKVVSNPQSEVLEEGYVFTPLKVCVDYAGRIYCIAQKMFEGIMVFDTDGRFTGFFGTIEVKISLWEKFWRRIASKEERSKQKLFIPTEFTGIDIDDDGFVYASNIDTDGVQAVKRLNPRGEDVIKKGPEENLGGDLWIGGYTQYSGPSKIVDVVYRSDGIYSLLDSLRGRVFTYDHEGNLLYIFGGLGTQRGTFTTPAAIEAVGETILVLDAYRAAILVFGETEYGALINEAVALRYDGDETKAVAKWEAVLRLDENNELANVGIGKAYLAAGDNEQAMLYLKRGMNKSYYSVAFKRYRNAILRDNLGIILTVVIALIIGLVVLFQIRRRRRAAGKGGNRPKRPKYGHDGGKAVST
ncbi:MAG: NHL repeat-containing protein [Clostridiales bacterium]|nr:NHL repeat-containing protein [Clostridiales bacterium]